MTYKAIYLTISVLLLGNTAQALEICGPKIQGAITASHAADVHEIYLNGKKIPVSDSGDFLLAFDRDARLKQELKILYKNEEEIYPEETAQPVKKSAPAKKEEKKTEKPLAAKEEKKEQRDQSDLACGRTVRHRRRGTCVYRTFP